ncbi:vWA domain-containing protein [Streptomyces sp. NPDC000405]|uniref:vWA domain-containing protein n=1 Tax=Streptomyces sp. NPDC000405 TaxID=3161033 RepID=UPI00398CE920
MAEIKGILLPAYVLIDESISMKPCWNELSSGLASLCEELRAEPMIAAKLRLGVLGFSEDVQVRLAVTDIRTETSLPKLAIRGMTNYGAVFDDLLKRIPHDVQWLSSQGYKVHRPVVFFLSDGQPTDGDAWRQPHAVLTDRSQTRAAPNIIACGIGEAEASTMLEVATREEFAFVAKAGAEVGPAISRFFGSIAGSLVASGRALNSSNPQLVVNRPDQFTMAIDEVGP